jgi:hypothetical protein
MKTNEIWTIVVVALVVSVISSVATVSLTGNVISSGKMNGTNVYNASTYYIKNPSNWVLGGLWGSGGDAIYLQKTDGIRDLIIGVNNPRYKNNISFQQDGREVMRIDSNGNVVLPIVVSGKNIGNIGLAPEGLFQEFNENGNRLSLSLGGDNLIMNKFVNSSGLQRQSTLSPGSVYLSEGLRSSRLTSEYILFVDQNGTGMFCYPNFVTKTLKCS